MSQTVCTVIFRGQDVVAVLVCAVRCGVRLKIKLFQVGIRDMNTNIFNRKAERERDHWACPAAVSQTKLEYV